MGAWDVKIVATREYSNVIEASTADKAQEIAMQQMGSAPENVDETMFRIEITRRA